MNRRLCIVFFASGAAGLLFEMLWFREAAIAIGNSVWTTSLVTSSFMAGIGLGNALAARYAERLRRPVLVYAGLEALVAAAGLALVILLPGFTATLAPLFTRLLPSPGLLTATRLACAFSLLVVPATAMGATLPLLARALSVRDPRFGPVLGMLYGFNTLGAVLGALAGEGLLVARLGVRGTGLLAAGLDLVAALAALALSRQGEDGTAAEAPAPVPAQRARRLLVAAFLCGAILLALETVWFRLLLLFVFGTSLSFAVMLSVVLLGIALGGLLGGLWLRREPEPADWLATLALAGGTLTAWGYAALSGTLGAFGGRLLTNSADVAQAALPLLLPTALVSGLLFTAIGASLRQTGRSASGAAGALTLANTAGATLGALVGGFLLLPRFGVERSLFALALAYAAVALLTLPRRSTPPRGSRTLALAVAALGFAATLALFPFGLMRNHYLPWSNRHWQRDGSRLSAQREGLSETISYLTKELWGEPVYHRLVTNGFSMSASHFSSRRYMELFVRLPVALHPRPRKALLISYGVGITAKALTDTRELTAIDVVDVSRDILELGHIVFPEPGSDPLDDPRVRVHVEDGRFFLLTTPDTYDLITGEPPPPKNAGIVTLYSREYFALLRARLAPGGIASYWLPVHELEPGESNAVIRAFCDAFDDCSLWTGFDLDWVLLGTRDAQGPVGEERFTAQWRDERLAPTLRAIGLESPELLGATFLADAPVLRERTAATAPLDDDHPLRVSPRFAEGRADAYQRDLDAHVARARFAVSALVLRLWPPGLRERTLAAFEQQRLLNRAFAFDVQHDLLPELDEALTGSTLRCPVLLTLRTSEAELAAARRAAGRGVQEPLLDELLGADALGDRDYARAAGRLCAAAPFASDPGRLAPLCVLALARAGQERQAGEVLKATRVLRRSPDAALDWLQQRFALPAH